MGNANLTAKPKSRYRNMDREKAAEIRRAYFSREAKQADLARRYGIGQNSISRIVSGQTWAEDFPAGGSHGR